jgi:hypothetical protein
MNFNTFLAVSFSINGGGGSGKFDMILFDCTGEGEKWCHDLAWVTHLYPTQEIQPLGVASGPDVNAILIFNATDLTMSHFVYSAAFLDKILSK